MKLPGEKTITCPFCFQSFPAARVKFRCINPHCSGRTEDEVYNQARGLPRSLWRVDGHVIESSADKSARSFFERFTLPVESRCDVCGRETNKRLCPHCHFTLSHDAGLVNERIIAIIGGRETGKSHYIASLIHRLEQDVGANFNAALHRIGDDTRRRWENDFYGPLFRNKKVLEGTQSAVVNSQVKEPMVFRLTFDGGRRRGRAINLTFFDTAGEDMASLDIMSAEARYIYKAAAIIFLLDPLQIPSVRQMLPGANLPDQNVQSEPQYIVERLRELFEQHERLKPGEKVQIPVAFTLSKTDVLLPIVERGSALRFTGEHFGYLNLSDVQSVHTEIWNYLQTWMGAGFNDRVQTDFEDYRYFGVSSLGQQPDAHNRLRSVSPTRVEDPLLWILYRLKIIKGREVR
jgi:GTPase SAR1 family protein